MSRIGKKPILITPDVKVRIEDRELTLGGPKGELTMRIPHGYRVLKDADRIRIHPDQEPGASASRALWGTTRALVANGVAGVTKGFEKKLEIEGIGYQARVENGNLMLRIGFTHPVIVTPLPGIAFGVERNVITVSGIDKTLVGQSAARIRALRKPEPYKGKGIRYQGEVIRRKSGKKAVAAA